MIRWMGSGAERDSALGHAHGRLGRTQRQLQAADGLVEGGRAGLERELPAQAVALVAELELRLAVDAALAVERALLVAEESDLQAEHDGKADPDGGDDDVDE